MGACGWLAVSRACAGGTCCGRERVSESRGDGRRGSGAVGRMCPQGMRSTAVEVEDQRSRSSRMRSSGRSVPRARRTSVRHVPESRSCLIGPRRRLPPIRGSRSGAVRCQLSRAATQVSNGMSTIRRNDGHSRAGVMLALMVAGPPGERTRPRRPPGGCRRRTPAAGGGRGPGPGAFAGCWPARARGWRAVAAVWAGRAAR